MKLSHSAAKKYTECPREYKYHYIDKYRSITMSGALLMGTAIDKATEKYVLTKDRTKTLETFYKYWNQQDINEVATKLFDSPKVVYSNNDLDVELLNESDHKLLAEAYGDEDVLEYISKLVEKREKLGFDNLPEQDKIHYNMANWLCLNRKGEYMLEAFMKVVDDNVEKVYDTQAKVELENEDRDEVIGFADLIVQWKGEEKPVILDIKTAGRMYEEDAVVTSPQLALYSFSLRHKYGDTDKAGFIVLGKNMNKNRTKICRKCGFDGTGGRHKTCNNADHNGDRCNGHWDEKINPTANVQIMINSIPETFMMNVVDNFREVANGIRHKVFPRNFNNCVKYNGTVQCAFIDMCRCNKVGKDLIKKDS